MPYNLRRFLHHLPYDERTCTVPLCRHVSVMIYPVGYVSAKCVQVWIFTIKNPKDFKIDCVFRARKNLALAMEGLCPSSKVLIAWKGKVEKGP